MKRLHSLLLVSSLFIVPTSPVMAADVIGVGDGYWSGPYIGLHGGYSWGSSEATYDNKIFRSLAGPVELEPEGVYGGFQAGYNYRLNSTWVLGLEADVALASISDEITDTLGNLADRSKDDTIEAETDWAGTLRGRIGYVADSLLIFATGGLAFASSEVTSSDCDGPSNANCITTSDDEMLSGLAVGAGAELMISDSLSAKLEYLYTDYSSINYFSDDPWSSEAQSSSQNIRAGVNYHF